MGIFIWVPKLPMSMNSNTCYQIYIKDARCTLAPPPPLNAEERIYGEYYVERERERGGGGERGAYEREKNFEWSLIRRPSHTPRLVGFLPLLLTQDVQIKSLAPPPPLYYLWMMPHCPHNDYSLDPCGTPRKAVIFTQWKTLLMNPQLLYM